MGYLIPCAALKFSSDYISKIVREVQGVKRPSFDPISVKSALEPLSAQIGDLEEAIENLVRRNDVVDEEIQGMKADLVSLAGKILAIKVSSIYLY